MEQRRVFGCLDLKVPGHVVGGRFRLGRGLLVTIASRNLAACFFVFMNTGTLLDNRGALIEELWRGPECREVGLESGVRNE